MTDLISRQVAIMHFVRVSKDYECRMFELKEVTHELWQIPAVEPKKGKWIPKEERAKQEIFICSECGGWAYSPWIGSRKTPKPNWCKYAFCPNCGARMEVEE